MAGFLLVGYRPGGPADVLVGLAALVPLGVALAAVAWPPAARGGQAFRLIVALGVASIVVLLPTLGALARQLTQQGLQTLLPSLEAAYPWALAILGTSLFAGLGLARRARGPRSSRVGRFGIGVAIGLGLAIVSSGTLAGATIANEVALRDSPAAASRFGPTDPDLVPPPCDGVLAAGSTARLTLDLDGSVDGGSLGIARLRGTRVERDFRWLAQVATTRTIGLAGAAAIDDRGWIRDTSTRWLGIPAEIIRQQALDLVIVDLMQDPQVRSAAEDLGTAYVEGARARHCRIATDGATFRVAFPQVRWLVGDADLDDWRGSIDLWVFGDGQLGRVDGHLDGPGFAIEPGAIRGRLYVTLTATERGNAMNVLPPIDL